MSKMQPSQLELLDRIESHLCAIYDSEACAGLAKTIFDVMGFEQRYREVKAHENHWDQTDVLVISYGDSVIAGEQKPLHTLHEFLNDYLAETVSGVHILPFYPFSSDDGFSVINYLSVNESLGNWGDIKAISKDFRLMADLVINHCSARSQWFENFKTRTSPGLDYFYEASPESDLSKVVRPRTSPLLREVETADGTRHVWCTFSHDQVDLNFENPQVLLEFVKIIRHYMDNGVTIFRLDAIAFLWKKVGTASINLPQTHEIVRLLRTLVEHYHPDALIITETNIPNIENLSYFGNANEAHLVYNFSLPPLLVNSLVTGDCRYLKTWMMGMPPAQTGTTYFNFIASHDGIGLRPAEGLLSEAEIDRLVNTMRQFGGEISWRALDDGKSKPYEINISLFDALSGTIDGQDEFAVARFICAHAVMLALEGLPAFYLHSLVATRNDYDKVEHTSHKRSINRHRWNYDALKSHLDNDSSHHAHVFSQLKKLIAIRRTKSAFHPNAPQYIMHLGNAIFAFRRESLKTGYNIYCLHNMTRFTQTLKVNDLNLLPDQRWRDLLTQTEFDADQEEYVLQPYQVIWLSQL